jgi:hypothetical protein
MEWQNFYDILHESPGPSTYQNLFTPDIEVDDRHGH